MNEQRLVTLRKSSFADLKEMFEFVLNKIEDAIEEKDKKEFEKYQPLLIDLSSEIDRRVSSLI